MTEISKEYASALFMLACENQSEDIYASDLKLIEASFSANEEYISFLASPAISLKERLDALHSVFEGKVDDNVLSYVKLMCEKGRIADFMDSVKEYSVLFNESKKVLKATVTTAVELTEEEKNNLKNKFESEYKCSLIMEYIVDSALLGGIIAEIDGKILDGSLRTRLHNIKEVIKE